MQFKFAGIVARQEIRSVFRSKMPFVIYTILLAMLMLSGYLGWKYVDQFNRQQVKYSSQVQNQWMSQPNRHPHRVAHYGYLVFREKSPLSFFDFGLDSYVGNSVFLEAHRQNTINMSEAGFSNGMLRFGELSIAMVFQLLVPLFIVFLGFGTVSGLKQNGVLKILLCQKASYFDILAGKAIGLTAITWLLFLPLLLVFLVAGPLLLGHHMNAELALRCLLLVVVYATYFLVLATIVTAVSAVSKTPAQTLVTLILLWCVGFIVIPKSAQTIGNNLFKAPDKIAFEQGIEADVHEQGDSHNPDDPHFTQLRINTLKKYGVDSVQQLPVNYGALVMQEGERISSGIFNTHFNRLIGQYKAQNGVSVLSGFFDPYMAVRQLSMSLCEVDFETFTAFQKQTEKYRFDKTTLINNIHLTQISYQNDRNQKVSNSNWQKQPLFQFERLSVGEMLHNLRWSLAALMVWLAAGFATLKFISTIRHFQL